MSLPIGNVQPQTHQTEDRQNASSASARTAAFREQYVDKLAGPYGWWAIASLDWLEPGDNLLGSSDVADLPLPSGAPKSAAMLELTGEEVTVTPLTGGLSLDGEVLEEPRVTTGVGTLMVPVAGGPLRVALIRRAERFGVRVYDPRLSAARDRQNDVAWFEHDPTWVVDAEFLPPLPDETIEVVNALGQVSDAMVMGRAVFERDGKRVSLVATPAGAPGRLFFNFRDETNLKATYGGGRFLNVDGPENGRIVLDFNLCHHPPCAHTPYATCPVPPEENRLPLEVRAGERYADDAQ